MSAVLSSVCTVWCSNEWYIKYDGFSQVRYIIAVGKPSGKRPFGRSGEKWKNILRQTARRQVLRERCWRIRSLSAFAKLKKPDVTFVISVYSSVRSHGTHWTHFHEMLYFRIFLWICGENSSFMKNRQEYEVLYVKTEVHFWSYLAQFLEWKMFQ